jgi:hypothetical protein
VKALGALLLMVAVGGDVQYIPSILYGHILVGSETSRYETVFTVVAKKATRSRLDVFTDKGERMDASFVDEKGETASTGNSFEFFLMPGRPLTIKLALMPEEAIDEVAVKTGWATFSSSEDVDINATVRITTPDGKLITRHILGSERPPTGD